MITLNILHYLLGTDHWRGSLRDMLGSSDYWDPTKCFLSFDYNHTPLPPECTSSVEISVGPLKLVSGQADVSQTESYVTCLLIVFFLS